MSSAVGLRHVRTAALWTTIALIAAWTLFPFWWGFVYSLKPATHLFDATILPVLQYPPTPEHWEAEWADAFTQDGLVAALYNGVIVGLGAALLALGLGLPAAVGLVRFPLPRVMTAALITLFLLPRMVPPVVLALPLSLLARRAGIADTRLALVLFNATLSLPVAILVLQSALRELPPEILESARLEGASTRELLWRFILPLTAPSILAVGFLCVVFTWNEFLFALANHGAQNIMPSVAVAQLEDRDGIPFAHVGSHLTLIMLPPLILAFLAQRYLVRGLTFGALRD